MICKVKEGKKGKVIESAVISSVKDVNFNEGFHKFDSSTSKYVVVAVNLKKTFEQLNDVIHEQEAGYLTNFFASRPPSALNFCFAPPPPPPLHYV